MKIRSATPDDVSLIFSFIQKKSEFDRNIGAFSGVLQVSEDKIRKTLFGKIPFSYVLFAGFSAHEVGFALYNLNFQFLIFDRVEELDLVGSWELVDLLTEQNLS